MFEEVLQACDSSMAAPWSTLVPGVRVCRFSLQVNNEAASRAFVLRQPLYFEAVFCCEGAIIVRKKDGDVLRAGKQDILLLSDGSSLKEIWTEGTAEGILVSVHAVQAEASLHTLRGLLGGLPLDTKRVGRRMAEWEGCAVLRGSPWSQAVFEHLPRLSPEEQGHYCVFKSAELLYLLCSGNGVIRKEPAAGGRDPFPIQTVARVRAYLLEHLDQKRTISDLCSQFYLSPTALKAGFRHLYGQPIHSWLQEQRMERAAELLRTSSNGVLQVAQMVGYEGTSQFNAVFKRRFGMSPGQYRKMSESGES